MATFTERGRGWQAKVRRKGFSATQVFKTKAAAERWARKIEDQIDDGVYQAPSKEAQALTLGDALARYEREVIPKKKGAGQELSRSAKWRAHPLAARPLAKITVDDIQGFIDDALDDDLAPSTIRLDLALVSHLYTTARKRWGLRTLANPVADADKPSTSGNERDRRLQPGELWRLFWACRRSSSPWLAPVVVLAIRTAMRRGEIAGLHDLAVAGNVAKLAQTKNGSPRTIPLTPGARRALRAIRRACGGVLALPTSRSIGQAFAKVVKAEQIPDLRFHDLRHEATSRLFEAGLQIHEVAAITGHKTWAMLKRYTHPKAADLVAKLEKKKPAQGGPVVVERTA